MLRYPLFIFHIFLLHFLPFTFPPSSLFIFPSFPFHHLPVTFSPLRYSHYYHMPPPQTEHLISFSKNVISIFSPPGRENFPQPCFLFHLQILDFRAQVQDNCCPSLLSTCMPDVCNNLTRFLELGQFPFPSPLIFEGACLLACLLQLTSGLVISKWHKIDNTGFHHFRDHHTSTTPLTGRCLNRLFPLNHCRYALYRFFCPSSSSTVNPSSPTSRNPANSSMLCSARSVISRPST
jgi:hypothetical protein